VLSAIQDFPINQYSIADLSWGPGEQSWPITSYFYLLINKSSTLNCQAPKSIASMVYWIYNSSSAEHVNEINYGELSFNSLQYSLLTAGGTGAM